MKKISKTAVFMVFFLQLLLVSLIALFLHPEIPYKTYFIFLTLAPLVFYTLTDAKMEKTQLRYMLLTLVSIILISLGQYIYSYFQPRLIIYGTLLFAAAAVLMVIAGGKLSQAGAKEEYPKLWFEIAAVIVLFGLALFLRIYKISLIPPGIWFDEALNGLETMHLMQNNTLEIFIPRQTQMPAMFFYLSAAFFKLAGSGLFQMRLVSIILGTLCVPVFYLLLRYIFKNYKLALFGAFLLATSRWHINFSRVAFLGMQTVFLSILFAYFYLRMVKEGSKIQAALAGLTAGIALYTYSTSNFLPVLAVLGIFVIPFRDKTDSLKKRAINLAVLAAVMLVTALPLVIYAVKNREDFSRRAADVSIMNDIKRLSSVEPLGKSLLRYSLMFNYEGDYNGRHNLHKKPAFDEISGVLLITGLILSLINPALRFYVLWGLIMLLPGLLTIVVEAPQQYRTTGMIPPLYIIILAAVAALKTMLEKINARPLYMNIFLSGLALGIAGINYKQYFIDYPKSPEVYISYAPESNEIMKFIEANHKDYAVFVDAGKCHYGYYSHETQEILAFMASINNNNDMFSWMGENNTVSQSALAGKKGVALLVRPCDKEKESDCKSECVAGMSDAIEKDYKDRYELKSILNPFTAKDQALVYFIKNEDLKKVRRGENKFFLQYEE